MSGREFYCPLDCGLKCYSVMRHINFCKNKSLLGKIYIQCPFNPEHIFKKTIMNIHIHECPENQQEKEFEEKVSKINPIKGNKDENSDENNEENNENINENNKENNENINEKNEENKENINENNENKENINENIENINENIENINENNENINENNENINENKDNE